MGKRGRKSFYQRIDSLPNILKYTLSAFFVAIIILNVYLIFFYGTKTSGFATSSTAAVIFAIENISSINITSPLNDTYNFSVGSPYYLDLNLTYEGSINSWAYSLYDLRHNRWVYYDVAFIPNITLNAVRWGNQIFVDAIASTEEALTDDVVFFVYVPNTVPIINGLNSSIYVCEGSELTYDFNATDADEDILGYSITSNAYPYFFFFDRGRNLWGNTTYLYIQSSSLPKNAAGGLNNGFMAYPLNVSVNDNYNSTCCSDTAEANITVIEINNPPSINPPLGLTTETVWNRGDNSTLFRWVNVSDLEYDAYGYGAHNFNITIRNSSGSFVNLFGLNRLGGNAFINFTANQTPIGTYNVLVCVNDTGINNPYPLIQQVCGQTGRGITTCDNFQLTITNQNRPPTITDHYPLDIEFNASASSDLYFNITKYDPDGTIPDTYWYVNGVLEEFDEGNSSVDELRYTFPCGTSGIYSVRAEISDGELNDSLQWNITVALVDCPVPESSGGGGGGGGGGDICAPTWGCSSWNVCQNAKVSLEQGLLSGLQYRSIEVNCTTRELTEDRCGFQIRYCSDLKSCNSSFGKPGEVQDCLYIENPSCSDGFKNCHDGDCELLVDCGGPCVSCPSCTDGIKNQGEEGKDCGGPCPWKCIPEIPLLKRKEIIYGFLILLLLIIIIVIIQLIRVFRYRKAIKQRAKPNV